MTNLNKLKSLALKAVKKENYNDQPFFKPSEVLSLIEEIEAYRECLKFYADPDPVVGYWPDESDVVRYDGYVQHVFGKRAREVLKKFGGSE
jgi:hypothetical protein